MRIYHLTDRATNNWPLGLFYTLEAAEKALEEEEREDRKSGQYTPSYYQIIEGEIN